jgi:hypothetical protein
MKIFIHVFPSVIISFLVTSFLTFVAIKHNSAGTLYHCIWPQSSGYTDWTTNLVPTPYGLTTVLNCCRFYWWSCTDACNI